MSDVIARARAVMEAATPGPWQHDGGNRFEVGNDSVGYVVMCDSGLPDETHQCDARAIALAVNALPALLDAFAAIRSAVPDVEAQALLCARRVANERAAEWVRSEVANELSGITRALRAADDALRAALDGGEL